VFLRIVFVSILACLVLTNSVLAEDSLNNNFKSSLEGSDNLTIIQNIGQPLLYNGLYPLAEGTGYVAKQYSLQAAWNELAYSLTDGLSIGTQPVLFVYRTPNVSLKAKLFQNSQHAIALNTGLNVLLQNSAELFSKHYTTEIKNPNSNVFVLPVGLSHSYHFNQYLDFHHTFSSLNQFAESDIENKATFAYSAILQVNVLKNQSIFFHGGDVGLSNNEVLYLGASYRYTGKTFFAQLGYFLRYKDSTTEKLPLFDLGFIL